MISLLIKLPAYYTRKIGFSQEALCKNKKRPADTIIGGHIRTMALASDAGREGRVITCTVPSRWVVSSLLYCFQHPAAEGSREACKPHTDPTSPITKCEDNIDPSRPRRDHHNGGCIQCSRFSGRRKGILGKNLRNFHPRLPSTAA